VIGALGMIRTIGSLVRVDRSRSSRAG